MDRAWKAWRLLRDKALLDAPFAVVPAYPGLLVPPEVTPRAFPGLRPIDLNVEWDDDDQVGRGRELAARIGPFVDALAKDPPGWLDERSLRSWLSAYVQTLACATLGGFPAVLRTPDCPDDDFFGSSEVPAELPPLGWIVHWGLCVPIIPAAGPKVWSFPLRMRTNHRRQVARFVSEFTTMYPDLARPELAPDPNTRATAREAVAAQRILLPLAAKVTGYLDGAPAKIGRIRIQRCAGGGGCLGRRDGGLVPEVVSLEDQRGSPRAWCERCQQGKRPGAQRTSRWWEATLESLGLPPGTKAASVRAGVREKRQRRDRAGLISV